MSKSLIIAEKPSVGRDISRVLKCENGSRGYHENNNFVVTWAMGHLVELAPPKHYNASYERWSLEVLPLIPDQFDLEVIKRTSRQFYQIKKLIHRQDIKDIVIATDAGREGELVARWILELAGSRKPTKRLWISSVTDKAIRDGFNQLKDGNQYNNLFMAAKARSEADWMVGLNASRALTCKYNESLSCGRVQTPTLSMIAYREDSIKSFIPKSLYKIQLNSKGKQFTLFQSGKVYQTENEKAAKEKVTQFQNHSLKVTDVSTKKQKKMPNQLYDLTTLQRDADQRYDFSAKETLRCLQSLYETHKILTYPRTDSKHLTQDIVETLDERLKAIQVGTYKSFVADILRSGYTVNKHFVDDSKVSDHHAIIPTEEVVDLKALSAKEFKIYDMVVRRFLAVLMPPAEYETITIEASCEGESFIATQSYCVRQGHEALEGSKVAEHNGITTSVGTDLEIDKADVHVVKTSPPPHFTEGLLLQAMETNGLGTVATRADIIEKLLSNHYIDKKGKYLYTTKKGRQLLELVPKSLKTPLLTAEWEQKLKAIEEGKLSKNTFVSEMAQYSKDIVKAIKINEATYKHDNVVSQKCPECGSIMVQKETKFGQSIVCVNAECGYRNQLSKKTNARCPSCHKKMKLVGEGEGRRFVCSCGYKEKLSAFEARKKNSKKQMQKKDVKKYLNQQDSDGNFNNPFSDLLKRIEDK